MSRSFNGSTDFVTFSAGGAAIVQGPITMAALVRPTSVTGERPILAGVGSGFGYLLLINDGQIIVNDYFGSGPTIAANNWYWVVATKASGNATPTFHVQQIGGGWSHTTGDQAASDDTDVASSIYVGYDGSGHFSGDIAAVAIWNSVLSNASVQAACTLSAADLKAANPVWMTRWNQASTGTSVTDDMAGGGNQSAITGTTVDTVNEPAGWSYSLSSGPTLAFSSAKTAVTPTAAALTSNAFTPTAGDVLVVKGSTWDSPTSMSAPTGGSLTWTQQAVHAPGGFNGWTGIWTAVATGSEGSMTVSSTPSASAQCMLVVERWTGAQLAATPATASGHGVGTPSLSITTTAANSDISWISVDAGAHSPASRAYLLSATEDGLLDGSASADSVQYAAYAAVTTAGSYTFGMSAPASQNWNMAGIEIKAAAGGGPTNYNGTASIAASAAITTAGTVGKVATASVPTTATISASGLVAKTASSSLSATAALAAQGATGVSKSASLAISAALTAQGAVVSGQSGSAALSVSAALTAQGVANLSTSDSLGISAALTAQGSTGVSRSANLAITAALAAQAAVAAAQGAALGVSAALSAQGSTDLSSSASIALSALMPAQGSSDLGPNGYASSAFTTLITAQGVVAIPGLATVPKGPIQRRRGLTVTIYPTKVIIDSRGNQVAIADMDHGYDARVWIVPERSQKAEVGGGQQDNNIIRLGTGADLPGLDSWSRVGWDGVIWDVVMPPAYHHGTRHVRHWTFDVRRRPSQHG